MSPNPQQLLTKPDSPLASSQIVPGTHTSETLTPVTSPVLTPEHREITLEISQKLRTQTWFRPLRERLLSFLSLKDNWDGYKELPIHESAVKRTVAILNKICPEGPKPEVGPMYDGGIQIEWEAGSYEIEIEVPPTGPAQVFIAYPGGEEEEVSADSGDAIWVRLQNLLVQMKSAVA